VGGVCFENDLGDKIIYGRVQAKVDFFSNGFYFIKITNYSGLKMTALSRPIR